MKYIVKTKNNERPQFLNKHKPEEISEDEEGNWIAIYKKRKQFRSGTRTGTNIKSIKKMKKKQSKYSICSSLSSDNITYNFGDREQGWERDRCIRHIFNHGVTADTLGAFPNLINEYGLIDKFLQFAKKYPPNFGVNKQTTHFGPILIDKANKKTHLFIYGVSNSGKSHFVNEHAENKMYAPKNNDWCLYSNNTEYIIFEEFDNDYFKKIGWNTLNQIMDGTMNLNTKGGSFQMVQKKIVIFIAQHHPAIYFKPSNWASFKNRTRLFEMNDRKISEIFIF